MPGANRLYVPDGVWHITHRCHKMDFLIKFEHDRLRWKHWLFQARKRYGLCELNYIESIAVWPKKFVLEMQARFGMKTLCRPISNTSAGTFLIEDA